MSLLCRYPSLLDVRENVDAKSHEPQKVGTNLRGLGQQDFTRCMKPSVVGPHLSNTARQNRK